MLTFKRIFKFYPLIVFHLFFIAIFLANFSWGKFFLGWDALNPEFDFGLNFKRAIFAGWQENYGTGALTGHGFAATLPHTLTAYFLSLFLPDFAIRQVFTYLCFYLGGLGMFFLVNKVARKELVALLAALFYMLNLGTMQIFYVQLETFIAQFASLPWLFLIAVRLLEKASVKNFIIFVAINFFASLQGFIPSLFVAYILSLFIFLTTLNISKKFNAHFFKCSLLIGFGTLMINAYWLLPVSYFQIARGAIYANSYNNLMSNQHFMDINKKYGDLANVAILKGYLFESHQLGDFVLRPFVDHLALFTPLVLGYLFFLIILLGLLYSLFLYRAPILTSFAVMFVFFFLNIATDTPPFSYVTFLLKENFSVYEQAFRTAFTKFSIGLAFCYSIFFAIGVFALSNLSFVKKYFSLSMIVIVFIGLMIFYSLPVFTGNLIYKKLLVDIPSPYFEIMNFFKDKRDFRIADFPQGCNEGWYAYKWGYFGSGFYWYGIKQPILARSFDVWSNYNENYFWEINAALKAQDYNRVDWVFQKYQVKWILYDPNLLNCRNQNELVKAEEFLDYLSQNPKYKLSKVFTAKEILPISLFENPEVKDYSFVRITKDLKNIGPDFHWNDNDLAYYLEQDYILDNQKPFDLYFPFRSVFTNRKQEEHEFKIDQDATSIIIGNLLPKNLSGSYLHLKKYRELENSIAVSIRLDYLSGNTYDVTVSYKFPQLYIDNEKLYDLNFEEKIGQITYAHPGDINVVINGLVSIKKAGLHQGVFHFSIPNKIVLYDSSNNLVFSWDSNESLLLDDVINKDFFIEIPKYQTGLLKILIPKVESGTDSKLTFCDAQSPYGGSFEIKENGEKYLRIISQGSKFCLNQPYSTLYTSQAYLADISVRNIKGNGLKISALNKDRVIMSTAFVGRSDQLMPSYFVIPPTFKHELGINVYLENISENRTETINDLSSIKIWPIPYNFITNLNLRRQVSILPKFGSNLESFVYHPNEVLFVVEAPREKSFIVLSQSYDKGWVASSGFKFLRAVKVNNWENGWEAEGSQQGKIYIFYLPQIFEFLGWGLGLGYVTLILRLFSSSFSKDTHTT